MLAGLHQDTSKTNQSFAIQLEGLYGRPSDAGQTEYPGRVVGPSKMFGPTMPARVKQ